MLILLLASALSLAHQTVGFDASIPTAKNSDRTASIQIPQPTKRADLLGRADYVKNCGFVNGNLELPLDCLPGYDCTHDGLLIPRVQASVSGCCATAATASKCYLDTTCIDWRTDATSTAAVPRAYYCNGAQPICTTAYFVDNYAMFTCGNGQKARIASAFYHASYGASGGSSASTEQPSGSVVASSGSSGNHSDRSSTAIGPIVGGVVGGVAVLIIAPTLAWFALRLKRKDRAKASASSADIMEMRKPESQWSASELCAGSKSQQIYSELEVYPAELPLSVQYAHEMPLNSVMPASSRAEFSDSAPTQRYVELDGKS